MPWNAILGHLYVSLPECNNLEITLDYGFANYSEKRIVVVDVIVHLRLLLCDHLHTRTRLLRYL